MILYEIKINYERQTGEDNPGNVKETYLVEGLSPADVEGRLMDEIQRYISGDSEVVLAARCNMPTLSPRPKATRGTKLA